MPKRNLVLKLSASFNVRFQPCVGASFEQKIYESERAARQAYESAVQPRSSVLSMPGTRGDRWHNGVARQAWSLPVPVEPGAWLGLGRFPGIPHRPLKGHHRL